ncbi:DUF3500 domain-containing protein [Kineococcus arenarius]|uniref:DUF3500 domain-containing protein n=1 Tax=unclassified Kineococcus TaxID=2621656 RepID=UPI003D7EA27F
MTQHQDIDGFFTTARVTGRAGGVELPRADFRDFLPDPEDPELARWRGLDVEEFSARKCSPGFVQELLGSWRALYDEPFVGVTSDGVVRDDVHRLPPAPEPDGTDLDAPLREAAQHLLDSLDEGQRERVGHPLDAPEWRAWSNPEFLIHRVGLRLEDLADEQADAALGLVRASLSPEGCDRVLAAMSLNGYLGELVGLPRIMNEHSYSISLFGTPAPGEPWGWQLFGHHVAVNFVTVGGRHVVAPVFLGAEPALSDAHAPLFAAREEVAVRLASSLTPAQRERAVVYRSVLDPTMPEGRLHPADERHVAGAFRDNRVVPPEGLPAGELTDEQWSWLRDVVADFLLLLVEPQRRALLREVEAHRGETFLAWYGATDGSEPFYLRIQSPVVLAELDHHAGVWLTNELPARFHVHTTLRLPNGNDYARAWISQWRARAGATG